jgi:hypothetical protein
MLEFLIVFAQAATPPDIISGGAGWVGAGLLGSVLGWLLFINIPAKDKQIAGMIESRDALVKEMAASHQEAVKSMAADYRAAVADMDRRCGEMDRVQVWSRPARDKPGPNPPPAPPGPAR